MIREILKKVIAWATEEREPANEILFKFPKSEDWIKGKVTGRSGLGLLVDVSNGLTFVYPEWCKDPKKFQNIWNSLGGEGKVTWDDDPDPLI